MRTDRRKSSLILEDNSVFQGYSFGYPKAVSGEVVFNTGMVGYPESLTDPSYEGQILALTYPLIGNYGVPATDCINGLSSAFESQRIHIEGLVVTNYSWRYSHWNASTGLADWLKEYHVPALEGIDTRRLTKRLREKGSMLGKILVTDEHLQFHPAGERKPAPSDRTNRNPDCRVSPSPN